MRGKTKPISLARKLVIDLMRASVPLVAVERTLHLERLAKARASLAVRPGWSAIMAKALCIVARDEPLAAHALSQVAMGALLRIAEEHRAGRAGARRLR